MISLMGVLNLTPDSFWEMSRTTAVDFRCRMERMVRDGADIIDIGAVSTRPGAQDVDLETEWERLIPAIEVLSSEPEVNVSVDTASSEIVRRAAGILDRRFIVNDTSAGEDDPEMLPAVSELGLGYVAMHRRGTPETMDAMTDYPEGVVTAVLEYFEGFARRAEAAGLEDWTLDPGFGFAKTDEQNMELLDSLRCFKSSGRRILVGLDDKRFVRSLFDGNAPAWEKAVRGGADILRVHDVAAARKWLDGFTVQVPDSFL